VRVLSKLDPKARRFASALVRAYPRFSRNLRSRDEGGFETYVAAPRGSSARALVCMSTPEGDVWVRFGLRNAFYCVDREEEMVEVAGNLLDGTVNFVVLSKARKWSGTTLVKRNNRPRIEADEAARIVSWSGKADSRIRVARARSAPRSRRTRH